MFESVDNRILNRQKEINTLLKKTGEYIEKQNKLETDIYMSIETENAVERLKQIDIKKNGIKEHNNPELYCSIKKIASNIKPHVVSI